MENNPVVNKPEFETRIPRHFTMHAGWYVDPWDISGGGTTERWWNGLIWTDRTRKTPNVVDRNTKSRKNEKGNESA